MSIVNWKYAKQIVPYGKRLLSISNKKCNEDNLTILDIDDKTGVATLSMNHPPVNALNIEFEMAILRDLERAKMNNVRGVILTSSLKNIFSAGLDITKLQTTDKDFLKAFVGQVMDLIETLHQYPLPTAALINGHAYAGGCVLASCCEYRVMFPNYRMSVSEVLLGMVPPLWVEKPILEVLGRRNAEIALTEGKAYQTEEAFKVGFIDEIAKDEEEGLQKCRHFIGSFKGVNASARMMTKNQFKCRVIDDKKAECENFVNMIAQPHIQKSIGVYLKGLQTKTKK